MIYLNTLIKVLYNNKNYTYFAEVEFSMKTNYNFIIYHYFFTKNPKHSELFNAY